MSSDELGTGRHRTIAVTSVDCAILQRFGHSPVDYRGKSEVNTSTRTMQIDSRPEIRENSAIHISCAAPFPVEPDQDADRADFQRTRFEVDCRESLHNVVGHVSAVIHGPAHAAGCDDWPDLFFQPRTHSRR